MKIRWSKKSAGVYESNPGRFRIEKHAEGSPRTYWTLTDYDRQEIYIADSLRESKQLADDQIDSEATK